MKAAGAVILHLLLLAIYCPQGLSEVYQQDNGGRRVLLKEQDDLAFTKAKQLLKTRLAGKAYKGTVKVTHLDECVAYFDELWPDGCSPLDLAKADVHACCAAGRNFVDNGHCLCELQIARGMLEEGGTEELVSLAGFCGITFPIPEDPEKFIQEPGTVPECEPYLESSINGQLTPEFLNLSSEEISNSGPGDLPTFGDLYKALPSGPFYVNYRIVNVTRPKPSILVNSKSTETEFKALVVYPVDAEPMGGKILQGILWDTEQPVSGKGPFPVLAFSPGFEISPDNHFRTFHQLASHGLIVVAQYSTAELITGVTEDALHAWIDDIVFSLKHIVDQGAASGSFLEAKVDDKRLAIGGHSMGGGLSMPAVVLSKEEYGLEVKLSVHVSPACKLRGNQCDLATDGAKKLKGVNVLFISGDMDNVEKLKYAEYFRSQLPKRTPSELVVLEGATHCLWEEDPDHWRTALECGKGKKSPFEAIVEMQSAMIEFFKANSFVGEFEGRSSGNNRPKKKKRDN